MADLMRAVPPHLRPLVEDTPSSGLRLLAAWDGLSVESQIIVLTRPGAYGAISEQLAQKALASPNAYVRYLAVQVLRGGPVRKPFDSPWDSLTEARGSAALATFADQIAADPDPLVRYAPLGRVWSFHGREAEIDRFLEQPREARLAQLRSGIEGEDFAAMIRRALATGVREADVVSMVLEYLGTPDNLHFTKIDPLDVDGPFSATKRFHALWHLVPDVPLSAGYLLVTKLPGETRAGDAVPDDILTRMNPRLLAWLLGREDVPLVEQRKKLALTLPLGEDANDVIRMAVSSHFDLSAEERKVLHRSDPARAAMIVEACTFDDERQRRKPRSVRARLHRIERRVQRIDRFLQKTKRLTENTLRTFYWIIIAVAVLFVLRGLFRTR
jgi:hypothetical protein